MNQILLVNGAKSRKKVGTKTVVVFFAICLIVFGIILASISMVSIYKRKKEETVINISKPVINVSQNENLDIIIVAKDDKEIKEIIYRWNNEDETKVSGEGKNELTQSIKIKNGTNTLYIKAVDSDGEEITFEKQFISNTEPTVELESIEEGIKITVNGKEKLSYLTYRWDEEEEQKIEINQNSYSTTIQVPGGQHKLTINVVDEKNQTTSKEQTVIGDKPPTLNISLNEDKYLIGASDDELLTKVKIEMEGKDPQEIEINNKEFSYEIPLQTGYNRLIVTIYNKNNLTAQSKVMCKYNIE